MQTMQTPNFHYCRNIVSPDSQTASYLVSRHVVCYQSKARNQRSWPEASSWLGSYNAAWEWLHKLRRGMVRAGRDKLHGPVEVDETYIGGVGTQARGRRAERKTIVAIAAEVRGKGPGRIRMAVVPDVSSESLHGFVWDNVQIGSEVRTDGWSGYKGLDDRGFRHKAINICVLSAHAKNTAIF